MVRKSYAQLISLQQTWIKKLFLVIADTDARSLEPIQPDVIGASSVVPPLQIEATTEKVL